MHHFEMLLERLFVRKAWPAVDTANLSAPVLEFLSTTLKGSEQLLARQQGR